MPRKPRRNQHGNPLDHRAILKLRVDGLTWSEVAETIGYEGKPTTLCSAHQQWVKRQRSDAAEATAQARSPESHDADTFTQTLTGRELAGLQSLDDLALFFDVDTDVWEVSDFLAKGNTWQQRAKGEKPTNLHQYKIQARFRRKQEVIQPLVEKAFQEVLGALERIDIPTPPQNMSPLLEGRYLAELAIHDTHFGMLSWAPETGEDYDLAIAESDYVRSGMNLVDTAAHVYGPERFLYVVGHDLMHIDGMLEGKIPVTNRGTPQDLDSRLPKIFRTVVESVVRVAGYAATHAPVDIVVVRGNHDKHVSFYIGEVLRALFTNHPKINVRNEPRDLVFYAYGRNTLGLTHGEKILRKTNNLVNIFADECPPEMWISSHQGLREIHTGHFHKRMQGGYYPRGDMNEERGVVVRALPGLTATDAWHKEQGYRHRRAATLMVFDKEGGVAGLHEVTP